MRRHALTAGAIVALVVSFIAYPATTSQAQTSTIARAALGTMPAPILRVGKLVRRLPTISAGVRVTALEAMGLPSSTRTRAASTAQAQPVPLSLGCRTRFYNGNIAANSRVNQDCTYRRQAEEDIEANPTNPRNLIAGQNDSRLGYNKCGYDYSLDGGTSWGDGIPPFYQHTNPSTGHTYDAASDPAEAFDSRGDAFFSCVVFDVNDFASGVFVARSPAYAQGSFYNNIPDNGPACAPGQVPTADNPCSYYVVAEANDPSISYDKEFIAADSYTSSPYRDNVYVVFTQFNASTQCGPQPGGTIYGYCSSPIYFSRSTDGGYTWSVPMSISGSNASLCYFGNYQNPFGTPSSCDFDQGADIAIQPNGTIVVVFNNGNTAPTMPGTTTPNPNAQQLAVVSHDGGNTFSAPSLVGTDMVASAPLCDFGRGPEECVPGQYARTDDFPRIAVNRTNGMLYATWQDYRTGRFGVLLSQSADGVTWTASSGPVVRDTTDDSQAAIDANPSTGTVVLSYYQTAQVPNETSLASQGATFDPTFAGVQATNSTYQVAYGRTLTGPYVPAFTSLPFPAPDAPEQAGFIGDYSGLVVTPNLAHPIWADTRNVKGPEQGPGHDEDVFTQQVPIN